MGDVIFAHSGQEWVTLKWRVLKLTQQGAAPTGAALVNKAEAKSPPKSHPTKMATENCIM